MRRPPPGGDALQAEFAFRHASLLVLLACVGVSSVVGLLLTPLFAYGAADVIGLTLIAVKSALLLLWLWRRPRAFLTVGLIELTFEVVGGLLKVASLLLVDGLSYGLGAYSHWLPLMYLVAALVLPTRLALAVSVGVYASLLGLGVVYWTSEAYDPQHKTMYGSALIQLYVMHAAFIVGITLFNRLRGEYARALGQAELHQRLANVDALTGLPNRRQLTTWLEAATARGGALSVVLFDLDHFKRVNDTYGHDVGDEVLRLTADVTRGVLREQDHFGRWGGEEFLLILPGCDADCAREVAVRLQASLSAHAHPLAGNVTVSCGVAQACAGEDVQELLRRADAGLYAAKRAGRNLVRIAA